MTTDVLISKVNLVWFSCRWIHVASYPGSLHYGGGESGTFYHMGDIKDRHDVEWSIVVRFLAIQPIKYSFWQTENLLHQSTLQFILFVPCCYACTHQLQAMWADSRAYSHAVKSHDCENTVKAYLPEKKSAVDLNGLCLNVHGVRLVHPTWLSCVYPWSHACDKMYQALPLLSGAWEPG